MTSVDLYINFVLHAVYGKLGEADSLMRVARQSIQFVADQLHDKYPIESKPLHRGMLLDPERPLRADSRYTFMSWSEDHDVARWFGSCGTYVSKPLVTSNGKLRGYVLTLDNPPTRVLFHHSWARAFGMPLERLALLHPFMGAEGCRQIGWSLRTQCEVIIEPLTELPEARPVETMTGASLIEVDQRLTPPWCMS